uniref:Insulin-like peptide receptor isoform X4 n=1 Tax=Diabrotica virgifera virgifera TaxID=50390 RepID=A0A6P7FRH9_DIAVI
MFRMVIFVLILSFVFVDCEICETFRLNSHPKNLKVLENCTEIWGSLQIALFDNNEDYHNLTEKDYESYVFPKLRVISGNLLLLKIRGLTSIGQLFPNLNQIGGRELNMDYSLVIWDTDLKEM